MTVDFATALSTPHSGRDKAVIIDHLQYTRSVILRGAEIPWDDAVAYSNFNSQAHGLLPSDVTLFDIGAAYEHFLDQNEALMDAISARPRTGYALKTLLSDSTTTEKIIDLVSVISQTSKAPIVLQVPSPLRWLAATHRFSGSTESVDPDAAENLSVYIADWLRIFAGLPVSALLLDSRGLSAAGFEPEAITDYSPIVNIAENYRWTLVHRSEDDIVLVSSILQQRPVLRGTVIPQEFWKSDAHLVPDGMFYLAEIPADGIPETVLTKLKLLT